MYIIALTGGIGSGKSTVAELFSRHGVPIIDTDLIARELVQKGQPALNEIVTQFGKHVLTTSGELDRVVLRSIIFNDATQRKRLESILHPRIYAEVYQRVDSLNAPYCIIVVPLLAESKHTYRRDRTLVVDALPEVQLQRVMARDHLSRDQVQAILAAQTSREQRLALADDVITNNDSPTGLAGQVESLHQRYLKLVTADLPR